MKVKIVLALVVAIVGLYFLNDWVRGKKEYISGVPAADKPASGEVRQKFTVGFLPVT
jgi:hypothetical protein